MDFRPRYSLTGAPDSLVPRSEPENESLTIIPKLKLQTSRPFYPFVRFIHFVRFALFSRFTCFAIQKGFFLYEI